MSPSLAWLTCRRKRPDAAARIYCFPHGGGSAGEYGQWGAELSELEVWGVQYPGRGSHRAEPLDALDALVRAFVEGTRLDPPFAFFGHSLGAVVAFEVAHALRSRGAPGPSCLLLSASMAPQLHSKLTPLSHLADLDLLSALEESYGAAVAELRDDPELRELMMPPLRSELRMAETYHLQDRAPLDCPLVVCAGRDDVIAAADLEAWAMHTSATCRLHWFPGGHFYSRAQRPALLALIRDTLVAQLAQVESAPPPGLERAKPGRLVDKAGSAGLLKPPARRVSSVVPNIFAKSLSQSAARREVVDLGPGIPDLPAPAEAVTRAVGGLTAGEHQYAPIAGCAALQVAVAEHARRFHGMEVGDPETTVLVTAGATEATLCALLALIDPGDEVVVFDPCYDAHPAQIAFAGGVARYVPLQPPDSAHAAWWFSPQALAAAFSPRTKLALVNTPHNPTGKVFSRAELEQIAQLCMLIAA